MIFLAVLLLSFLLVRVSGRSRLSAQVQWAIALGIAMVVAGVSHLANPTPFVQHLPTWTPLREPLVFVSGLVEIALGTALFLRQPHRSTAGVALAIFLTLVFPANVYVAVAGIAVEGQPGGLYPWLRLPLQVLFVYLALWSTRAPSRARPAGEIPVVASS